MFLFSDVLYMLVRYASPVDVIGACGVVVMLCFITAWTCVVVSGMFVVCSLSVSYLCVC